MGLRSFAKHYLNRRAAYKFVVRDWTKLSDVQAAADAVATMRFTRNLAPLTLDGPHARRALVIAPHPDDESLGAGGTLARLSKRGAEIRTVFLTGSPAGKGEAAEAARILGFDAAFLDHPIGAIPLRETAEQVAEEVARFKPGALFLPFFLDDHDDHRRASHILIEAATRRPSGAAIEVWAYQVYSTLIPNVVVDITSEADAKRRAIRAYASQALVRDWQHWALGLNAFNIRHLAGPANGSYAETFFVLPLTDYLEVAGQYFGAAAKSCPYYNERYRGEWLGNPAGPGDRSGHERHLNPVW